MTIAYLANQFPAEVEPYVMEEIEELRARGHQVLSCSARTVKAASPHLKWKRETLYLQEFEFCCLLRSLAWLMCRVYELWPILRRILTGRESVSQRLKALLHTWLGAYYAARLRHSGVDHIHVHHGYFSAWVAMVAAKLLHTSYSMTLHGSDLLVNPTYLDIKLQGCAACFTVSEYNREYILRCYPGVPRWKIVLRRLGVECAAGDASFPARSGFDHRFVVLAVGRLHPVKNHSFLINACARLKALGLDFVCFLAGDGPERPHIEAQIRSLDLQGEVKLLGHVNHSDLEAIYPLIDLVVLTSKSEGIPLVLMEAMAYSKVVLAPNITGIPELVVDGKTGFLYAAGSLEDFVRKFELVHSSSSALGPLRRAAREHVSLHFNRDANLRRFAQELSNLLVSREQHANSVLQ